jgi:ATP-dependent Lon protease
LFSPHGGAAFCRAQQIRQRAFQCHEQGQAHFSGHPEKCRGGQPQGKDICDVGVIGSVLQLLRLPDGTVKALIEGKQRARIQRYVPNPEFFEVELSLLPDTTGDTIEVEALMRAVIDDFTEYAGINKSISKELLAKVSAISDPSKLADSVASHFSFKLENKQQLLETADLASVFPCWSS